MTNQEAAEMIRNDMKLHHDALSGEYRKALSMAISALQAQDEEQREEPLYCDRDICLRNEYNGIGCGDCEVTKSQQRAKDVKPVNFQITKITKHQSDFSDLNEDRESCENGYNRLDLSKVKFKPEPTPTEEALADVEPMFDVSEQSEDGDELDEAIKKLERIKRGNIFLIHQRIEGKEVYEDYSLCDIAISSIQELKRLRAEKDFSDPPDLESYKHGFVDGFNEGYKARERDERTD